MIQFNSVTRKYGRKTAVDQLCLTVKPGELFALLGPNGAGKTTTIKMLVGLLRPNMGSVRVCDCDVVLHTRQAVRHLGFVPDEPFLYDKLSGREWLDFAGTLHGLTRKTIADRIARETENFGLGGFLDDLIETYSHGMRQRLVFASALLHDPAVLVLDEPMVGLDPRSVRLVKDLLRQRVAAGMTVFMSTHTLAIAEEIADRIAILDSGHLHYVGSVSQLQSQFASDHASLESLFLTLTGGGNGHGTPFVVRQAEPHQPNADEPRAV